MYITYELWNPLNNQIFYVGAGRPDRPRVHLSEYKLISRGGWKGRKNYNRKKYETIKHIVLAEKEPVIKIVLESENDFVVYDHEIRLIRWYGRADLGLGPLTNMTDGGDGRNNTFSGKSKEEIKAIFEKRGNQSDNFKGAQKWYNSLSKKEQDEWHRQQGETRKKQYVVKFVGEEEFQIDDLYKFVEENNVKYDGMISSLRKGCFHRGWRMRYVDQLYRTDRKLKVKPVMIQYKNDKPIFVESLKPFLLKRGFNRNQITAIRNRIAKGPNQKTHNSGWRCWYPDHQDWINISRVNK